MKEKGFTLIELMITVAIIGILSAVAISGYIGVTKKASRAEAYSNLENLRMLEERFYAENATYTAAVPGQNPGDLAAFRPGPGTQYTYAITSAAAGVGLPTPVAIPYDGLTANLVPATAPCFIATATGIPGTRVCPDPANCDVFAIDCNNNRNF